MSDEVATSAPAEAQQAPTTTESTGVVNPPKTSETNDVDGEKQEDTVTKQVVDANGHDQPKSATAPEDDSTAGAGQDASAAADSASTLSNKKGKRKSSSGVPEHKAKKNNKKNPPVLHLDCKPGEYYWARLKGYPPWPAIICDEEMLPEILLATRPVSTSRPDGTIRPDFEEGGKNAKERTFPVMFLATNEFSWLGNTLLTPLDNDEIKGKPTAKLHKALKQAYELAGENHDIDYFKDLLKQFQEEEMAIQQERLRLQEEQEEKAAAKAAEKAQEGDSKKKKSRKSKGASEDAEMNDTDAPKSSKKRKKDAESDSEGSKQEEKAAAKAAEKAQEGDSKKKKSRKSKGASEDAEMNDTDAPKSSKKRKKDAESDSEGSKPKKTPKVTKLNAPKTPNGETPTTTKKSSSKPRKKVVAPKENEKEKAPDMTEEERYAIREKSVLFLRHKLQKCFLRDEAPAENEMEAMAGYFAQLEEFEDLQLPIIRKTKIHKVLNRIVRISTIPQDEVYHFKERSRALLNEWEKHREDETGTPNAEVEPKSAASETAPENKETVTNGEKKEDDTELAEAEKEDKKDGVESAEEKKAEEAVEKIEEKAADNEPAGDQENTEVSAETKDSKPAELSSELARDHEGDVSMVTAPETTEAS